MESPGSAPASLVRNNNAMKQLKESRKEDPQGFVRDVIKEWACRNPDNQVQVRIARIITVSPLLEFIGKSINLLNYFFVSSYLLLE